MDLEKLKISDIFIIRRKHMKNAISLGLFKGKPEADNRIEDLKQMGIKASVETQYTLVEEYWIDINVKGGNKKVVNSIQTIARGLTVLKLVDRECK